MDGAIILSRMDSQRLPGKALLKIYGKTLLEWCIESLKGDSNFITIVATTTRPVDDPVIETALKNNVRYFRGDTDNVAKRVLDCARHFKLDKFARINGDSPFIRKDLITDAFKMLNNSNYDFVTNLVPRRFPYGISVEVFRTEIFEKAFLRFESNHHKEHVTSYFYENITQFNAGLIQYSDGNVNDHHIRLVVDTSDDLITINKLMGKIGNNLSTIKIEDIVKTYNNINSTIND